MAYNYLESIAIRETKKIKSRLKEKEFEFVATLQHPDTGEERADGEKYIVSQPCALLGNEKEISGGFQYQFSKDKEGTFTFKYFTRTSKLQLQGKVLSFFTFLSKELEILGYDVLGKVIDDYEEIKSAPVDDILAVHLPTLHRKLSSTVKTIITPSLKLIKVNIDFSDHSIMLTPTFRVMEHVMAVILEDNGYQYNEKNGFDMFGHHAPKNMYQLRPNGSIGIAEETKNKLDKCYTFYNAHRHSLSHLGIDISEARVIKDRNKAIEILLESLELMEDLSDEFPL